MEQIVRSLVAQNALLSSRITAIESLVSKGIIDIGTVADPAPDGGGGGGGWGWPWRPGKLPVAEGIRWWDIPIHWDPVPEELGKLSRVQIESRLADLATIRQRLDGAERVFKEALGRAQPG